MGDFKDLFLLFIGACINAAYFNFGFFYSYNISYVKVFHPQYPIYLIYLVLIPLNLGLILMNAIFPKLIKIFQVQTCFKIYGVAVSVEMLVLVRGM